MTTEQRLINYMRSYTQGRVKLSKVAAAKIVDLVLQPGKCKVLFRRYSYVSNDYEAIQTHDVTEEKINDLMRAGLTMKPVDMFYRYDLYNQANELQGFIFTANPNLI